MLKNVLHREFRYRQPRVVWFAKLAQDVTNMDTKSIGIPDNRIDYSPVAALFPVLLHIYFRIVVGNKKSRDTVLVRWNCQHMLDVIHSQIDARVRHGSSVSPVYQLDIDTLGSKEDPR